MELVYSRISLIACAILTLLVTPFLAKPIGQLVVPVEGWMAWAYIVLTMTIVFRANSYHAFLQGTDHVALVRRWEAVTNLGSVTSAVSVLLAGHGLLVLVLVTQTWEVLNAARNYWLSHRILEGRFAEWALAAYSPEVFNQAWPRAWRSGLGVLLATGTNQSSGLIYAQIGTSSGISAYLIALRLADAVNQFSSAPFYSRLPKLAQLLASGNRTGHRRLAFRRIRVVLSLVALQFLFFGFMGPAVLDALGSDVPFVAPVVWAALACAYYLDRLGSLHLQLYSTTNHIVWHKINAVYAAIFFPTALVMLPSLGMISFPLAMLAAYAYYASKSLSLSREAFALSPLSFHLASALPPFLILLVGMAVLIWIQ